MKVWVTLYEHRHGQELSVYATEKGAKVARENIADEYWEAEMDGAARPSTTAETADVYFEAMGEMGNNGEWFTIEECEVLQ